MKTNEPDADNYATPRAGGDVITKSASQKEREPEAPESGTRAGGDVITKGVSQKHEETSKQESTD